MRAMTIEMCWRPKWVGQTGSIVVVFIFHFLAQAQIYIYTCIWLYMHIHIYVYVYLLYATWRFWRKVQFFDYCHKCVGAFKNTYIVCVCVCVWNVLFFQLAYSNCNSNLIYAAPQHSLQQTVKTNATAVIAIVVVVAATLVASNNNPN